MNAMPRPGAEPLEPWPALPLAAWRETMDTLHMWSQIVGKLVLAGTPLVNHWWNVTLQVTPRGLATAPVPYGARTFRIAFDLVEHRLEVADSDGAIRALPLSARPVALFYRELMETLRSLDIRIPILARPVEVEVAIPFAEDYTHAAYDPEHARRFLAALRQADRLLRRFRAGFLGKASPVHFFWGSFDLATTRFSGRRAPPHPGGIPNLPDRVAREAYSHEVSSAGWWPGGGAVQEPAFYAYAYPEPEGFASSSAGPAAAYYQKEMGEFILPYEAVRRSDDPDAMVLAFLEATYAAAAELGGWERAALERSPAV